MTHAHRTVGPDPVGRAAPDHRKDPRIVTTTQQTCTRHIEHRNDRATGRRIGLDARLNEWQPCTSAS